MPVQPVSEQRDAGGGVPTSCRASSCSGPPRRSRRSLLPPLLPTNAFAGDPPKTLSRAFQRKEVLAGPVSVRPAETREYC